MREAGEPTIVVFLAAIVPSFKITNSSRFISFFLKIFVWDSGRESGRLSLYIEVMDEKFF